MPTLPECMPAFHEKDEAKKKELMAKLASEALPDFAAKFEKGLKDNGGKFFVGDELTYADIWDECVQKFSNSESNKIT